MKNNKILKIALLIIAIIFVIFASIFFFAVKDPNKGKYNVEPSAKVAQDIIISTVTNKELAIPENDLNSALAYGLQKQSKNGSVNGVYFDLNNIQDQRVKVYVPIRYHSLNLGLSAYVKPTLNTDNSILSFEISNAKVGEVPIPANFFANKVRESEPDMFTANGNIVHTNAYIKYNINSTAIKIQIDKLELKEGTVVIKTSGLLKTVEDFIKGELLGEK